MNERECIKIYECSRHGQRWNDKNDCCSKCYPDRIPPEHEVKMNERERLIKELKELGIVVSVVRHRLDGTTQDSIEQLANYILSDRRRILEEIERPLREVKDINANFELEWGNCLEHKVIDTALKLIEERMGR